MSFLGISMVQTSLLQSGAFEVYINGSLKFSKLGGGRMVTIHDVNDIFAEEGLFLADH